MQTTLKTTFGLLVCGLTFGLAHTSIASSDEPNYRAFTLTAEGGTTGLGGSASWRFSDNFGVRGGVNFFSHTFDEFNYSGSFSNGLAVTDQKFSVKLKLMSEPIALDIYPSSESSFRVSLGVLVNQNKFSGSAQTNGLANTTFSINGNPYTQSGFPDGLQVEVKQQSLSPYVSVGGSFYFSKSRRWALGWEAGVAYTGSPDVTLSAPNHDQAFDIGPTPISDDLSAESKKIEKDAKKYQFYPIIKIGVSYSF